MDAHRFEDARPATARAGAFDHLGEIPLISGSVLLGRSTSTSWESISGAWA